MWGCVSSVVTELQLQSDFVTQHLCFAVKVKSNFQTMDDGGCEEKVSQGF